MLRPPLLPVTACAVLCLTACDDRSAQAPAAGEVGASVTAEQAPPRAAPPAAVQTADSYFQAAQADLARHLAVPINTGRARNVIVFIGDGMGVSTLTAGRIYQGQANGVDGESYVTAMDALPWAGLVKTYTHDAQVADSAPTATAIMTGVKTRNDVVGVDQTVTPGDCTAQQGHELTSLFEQAEDAGMATGVVSTAGITHATPASTYANVADRNWEVDSRMPPEAIAAGCADIARQLVEWPHGDGFEVMLGGSRSFFLPETQPDPEDADATGERTDGRNLVSEWVVARSGRVFVWNSEGFAAAPEETQQLLGLFERGQLEFESARPNDAGGEPSLAEMTQKAIAMLQRDEDGYVLMVEGGRIDHAHHSGMAGDALNETMALDAAVRAALEMVDLQDTLVVVTSDHSHGLVINGYTKRNHPILGLAVGVDGEIIAGRDGKPYTTLTYATGPGGVDGARADLTGLDTTGLTFQQPALIPGFAASHAGEDVAVRAAGPWAHLFSGTVEQNYLYHVMAHALGFGAPPQPETAQPETVQPE
jgi:alkaline phosphatase